MTNSISPVLLYSIMVGMLIFGSANTIISKLQDSTTANGILWNHPFFQCAVMFLGELMCLVFYAAKLLYGKYSNKDDLAPASPGAEAAN